MSPPHIRQNLILVTSLFTGFGWSPPSSHAATQETLSSYNYIRSDLYQVAMDAGGVALKIAGLAGPHSSRSNRIPLDIRVTNNGTETRTFTVNSRFYRQPSIANGYGLGEKLRVLTPRTTPVLAPGQSHLFTGEDFQLSLMLFFNAPGGNTTNKVYNHSYPPAGFPAGSVPDDGVNIVLANTYGIGLRLANNGSARPSQVFDNANLEVSVTGEIPYGGSYGGSDGIARSLTLSTAGSLPNIHLFAVPSTAPDRAGATPEDALGGCSSCENTSICTTAALNSLNYTISFPTDNFNEARSFRLKADAPHPKLTDPSALQLDVDLGFKSILGTQTLGQITTSSQVALIDIASPDEYTINFYHIADAGATESGDRYLNPTGTPHTTVKVEDPDPGNGNNQVKITRTTGTDIEISRYTYEAATDTWQLAAADGQRIEKITSTQSQVIPEIETEDREVTDAAGNTISKVVADYNQFPFGRRMISQTIDPNGRALITTYAYYGDDDGVEEGDPGYGKLHHTTTPTGNWRHFEYDAPGRLIKSVTPHTDLSNTAADYDGSQDAALRVMDYIFDDFPTTPGAPQETQVTTVLGTEISRRYTVKHPDGEDNITTVTPEAAYDAPDNLVTKRRWITTNGTFKFDPTRIDFPDGTASFFTHTLDPTGQQKITIASTGKPSTDGLSIEKGTSTVTVTNRQGTVLNTNTTDIETGLQLSKTAATSIDAFGRATTNSFLDPADNSIATTSTNYDCCGIANTTDRSGIYTNYDNHDDLISSQTSLGIKTTSIADPTARTGGGRIESLTRTAVDGEGNEIAGSTTLLQRREYDAAGYLVKEYAPPINADTDPVVTDLAARRATEFTDLIDHASGHRTRTVTNPDGTTVISKSHAGGRLMKITGTGTHHSRFEYGVEVPAGTNLPAMRFTKTVLLKKDGTDSAEWSKSYTDQAGRTPLAVTSSGATATSTYNAFGQMISQTDPDGVTALFAYDERGRLEITAEDLDRDGIIDYDGTDRISKTATTVSQREVDGENLVTLLTTIIAWTTDGDATTTAELSRSESTTDGLHTWSSSEGLETHTTMAYAGNGNYTSTGTNSNGTSTENIVLGGRLRSITSFDNTGTPTTGTTYDYDDLGRASTVTDARNGPTTITYYADDRVKSTTTPDPDDADPGTGRTTSLSYDTAGRRKTITLPDHTSEAQKVITYNYHPTGEALDSGGARTYTTGYGYDYAGRMKTLTAGAGTTTWNYLPDSGYLQSKLYADGRGTSYTHTPAGRPTTRTIARGFHRKISYDNSGIPGSVSYFTDNTETTPDPLTLGTSYTYDRLANLKTLTDAAGQHNFTTTPTGRTELETITGGILAGTTLNPTYDAHLRRHSLSFAALGATSLTHSYRYDEAGRYGKIATGPDPETSSSATYTYHQNSHLPNTTTSKTATGTTRLTLTRNFDAISRLTSITNLGAGSANPLNTSYSFDHNITSQREKITLADGSYWQYTYDPQYGHLETATKHLPNGTPIASQTHSFNYDNIGNRTESGGGLQPPIQTYSSNNLNQYDEVTHTGAHWIKGVADPAATVTVDSNPTTRPGAGDYFEYQTTADNSPGPAIVKHQITSTLGVDQDTVTRYARIAAAAIAPEHDADGNLTSDGIYDYTWDGENRLVTIQTRADTLPTNYPHHRLEFAYDSANRRIEKKIYGIAEGQWHLARHKRFLYDGWNLLAEYEPKSNDTWHPTASYLWGKDLSGSLQGAGGTAGLLHIQDHAKDQGYFVAYDGKGNVAALVDEQTGETSAQYAYTPFGKLAQATGQAAHQNPFRFSTRYCDTETGFYYYGYRFYDPAKGRWLNRDPLGESGGLNLYGFLRNDGVNRWDSLGLKEGCETLKEALLAAQLADAAYGEIELPKGWTEINIDAVHNDSGLDVSVFEGPAGKTVIAFRGTTDGKDWITNAAQGAGLIGRQYKESLKELSGLASKYPNASVVGHSLGGGLASVFGARHSRLTTTFNASGLHSRTLSAFGVDRENARLHVTAYYVQGEILSGLQDGSKLAKLMPNIPTDGIPTAVGNRIGLKADLADNIRNLGLRDLLRPLSSSTRRAGETLKLPLDLHLMDEVIEALIKKSEKCCDD